MASAETRALEILGGRSLLEANLRAAIRKYAASMKRRRTGAVRAEVRGQAVGRATGAKLFLLREGAGGPDVEPGELGWTGLIRTGLPAKSARSLAGTLGMSIGDLAASLRLPARTVHRRLEKGEALTPEESERSVRAARALAKAQDLLGAENGRGWVLARCRGLGGEIPITLLDTADGFTAVMDELGRLEHGVLS
jgi:putative toxin-antitoxin system antitoxin component (TIGR02293 family)